MVDTMLYKNAFVSPMSLWSWSLSTTVEPLGWNKLPWAWLTTSLFLQWWGIASRSTENDSGMQMFLVWRRFFRGAKTYIKCILYASCETPRFTNFIESPNGMKVLFLALSFMEEECEISYANFLIQLMCGKPHIHTACITPDHGFPSPQGCCFSTLCVSIPVPFMAQSMLLHSFQPFPILPYSLCLITFLSCPMSQFILPHFPQLLLLQLVSCLSALSSYF